MAHDADDPESLFLPPIAAWFRATLGAPTTPQRLGWPAIASGSHTLICAPTGSGKTLAAFLACLDHRWRHPPEKRGVGILYVSPLKALNHDIERNLAGPLAGILATAEELGAPLRPLEVAVRTGDTPTSERQRLARRPPDVLITTPESLHLLLTSAARETLRSVSHVIVDEIHALCPNKRGVFLALLLERLEAINPSGFVRVGLSATQRPLDEVARYLGGRRKAAGKGPRARFEPRPVTVVDAGLRKDLDLEVSLPGPEVGPLPGGSIWPAIERRLLELIREHRSTIVFANNRRVVERLTANLNELAAAEGDEGPIARSHHGSLSLDQRRGTEEALKRGDLRAVVATASLELGIDMGAVDLVCQVESAGGVARGLQRVGRAGHLVGARSKGRLLAKTPGDLLEGAALTRAMLDGAVEPLRVPSNCLDVLAQQVVACVAVDPWEAPALFDLVRGAYPYRDLTARDFERVLEMVSGRFAAEAVRDLRPRVSWDRVHNRLHPLPGSKQLALVGGGTIPDTGHFPAFLGDGGPRLGELDEEFVMERRVGEAFILGTSTWRIEAIEPHRVLVAPAEGDVAVMPFWRGEAAGRTHELGMAVGALTRQIADRLDDPGLVDWLRREYHLDDRAARALRGYVGRQVRQGGVAPDDRTVLIESSRDQAGELSLAVLTPFGGKLHQALKLAFVGRLRDRLGITPACLSGNDGVLIRLPSTDEPPLDLFDGLTAAVAESILRAELPDSPLFGLRFRQNAGRALLMPRPDPGKRSPLWLQRLRAKDLLQVVRDLPDFPIVLETGRECVEDDLDLPRLRSFLDAIEAGTIRVVQRRGETPSPFASALILRFAQQFLYEWDEPRRGDIPKGAARIDREALAPLLDAEGQPLWLDPAAVGRVEGRLRGEGQPPRTVDEMAEHLRLLGDLTNAELAGPMLGFLVELERQGRARTIQLDETTEPDRWIGVEDAPLFEAAFEREDTEAIASIVRRYLRTHALVGLDDLTARYPIDPAIATEVLESWSESWGLVRLDHDGDGPRWSDRRNLRDVQRLSIALRRRESVAVPPEVFAGFVARRQGVHPSSRREGPAALDATLETLRGFAATAELWEGELLPRRLRDVRPSMLDEALSSGGWAWRAEAEGAAEPRVAIVPRGFAGNWPVREDPAPIDGPEAVVLDDLDRHGARFADEIARATSLPPSIVGQALDNLLRRGLVRNDRFDPLRPGAQWPSSDGPRSARARLGLPRRSASRPEGRWSRVPTIADDPEAAALAWASALLDRFGVLARETAALDPWAPPWRELAPWLDRAELRGEVRRGYFVEGLSGVQYATAETADELARHAGVRDADATPWLVSTLDPSNLYGSGAPFDVPLLDGGTARLPRSASNWLVLVAGRPVLIVEGHGRRLTGLASASEAELRAAAALLPGLANPGRRVLKVETYNAAPALNAPAAPWLADVGFVRDPPGLAFYLGW
ncbi:MAG TPA: DEAD/DEAH box helicase [Isosphaeraceae bacterium]|jgi:ATP-dependent Lhr-like helicase|nr:DEAD/DEAH box helicase [Isosphaeraceae bacterium]